MNNGDNDEAEVTDIKGQELFVKTLSSTEGYLKVNDKRKFYRVNHGHNDEVKVTDDKGQELDCLKKVFTANEENVDKSNFSTYR